MPILPFLDEVFVAIKNTSGRGIRFKISTDSGLILNGIPFQVKQDVNILIPRDETREMMLVGNWESIDSTVPIQHYVSPPNGISITVLAHRESLVVLERQIQEYINHSNWIFRNRFGLKNLIYVIKYMPATRLKEVLHQRLLFASKTKGFTWGDAVYVTPLTYPYSTMMYGCVGIVGTVSPVNTFDASNHYGTHLYQQWIRSQFLWYDLLTTSYHSSFANNVLRNRFRTRFQIDCVVFSPDQFAPGYVNRFSDVWFAMTKWSATTPRRAVSGTTNVVSDLELTVVLTEEFRTTRNEFSFEPLIGNQFRQRGVENLPLRIGDPNLAAILEDRYMQQRISGNQRVLVMHEIL